MNSHPPGGPPHHVSVLPAEVLAALDPRPGQVFVDATVGAGGHSRLLAERLGPTGRLIGLDRDASMLALAAPRLEGLPVTLLQGNFDELPDALSPARRAGGGRRAGRPRRLLRPAGRGGARFQLRPIGAAGHAARRRRG